MQHTDDRSSIISVLGEDECGCKKSFHGFLSTQCPETPNNADTENVANFGSYTCEQVQNEKTGSKQHTLFHKNKNQETDEPADDTDSNETSDRESSYSSTGPITCSLAKRYEPNSPTSSGSGTGDGSKDYEQMPVAWLTEEDVNAIESIVYGGEEQKVSRIFPKASKGYLESNFPRLYKYLTKTISEGWMFVTFSLQRAQGTTLEEPKKLLFDLCLISPTKPVLILTITSENQNHYETKRYNSEVATLMIRQIFRDVRRRVQIPHGVVKLSDMDSDDSLQRKLEKIYSDARVFAIPGTLDVDVQSYQCISNLFLTSWSSESLTPDVKVDLKTVAMVETTRGYKHGNPDCCDVEQHKSMKKELSTLRTENKVLRWTLQQRCKEINDDARTSSEVNPSFQHSPMHRNVFRQVLLSMEGDLVDILDPVRIKDALIRSNVVTKEAVDVILSYGTTKEQTRALIRGVLERETSPSFIDVLKDTRALKHVNERITKQLDLLLKVPESVISGTDEGMFTSPGKVVVLDKKKKILNEIFFSLRIFLSNGELKKQEDCVNQLREHRGGDPDVMFHVHESDCLRERLFRTDDLDQTAILSEMENLIPQLTHPGVGVMVFLARKGSFCAMKGDLEKAVDLLTHAKSKTELVQPCLDTVCTMNTFVNLLMLLYEAEPTLMNKDRLIKSILETIEMHIPHAQSANQRDEFRRILYLKLTFAFLGIGLFGTKLDVAVTADDIKATEACFRVIETFQGSFDKRRSMFFSLAKAVLHSVKNNPAEALKYAQDSSRIAELSGFRKERQEIEDWTKSLEAVSPQMREKKLMKCLEQLSTISEHGSVP